MWPKVPLMCSCAQLPASGTKDKDRHIDRTEELPTKLFTLNEDLEIIALSEALKAKLGGER